MRNIAPEIFADEFFGNLSMTYRVLWIGLLAAVADDQGRFIDNPALIRSIIFPYDTKISIKDVEGGLSAFTKAHKINRYTVGMNGSGKRLVQIINWWKYQKATQWARESLFQAPPKWLDRVRIHKPGNGNVPYTLHWDSEGGYVQPTKEVRTSYQGDRPKPRIKPRPKPRIKPTTPTPPKSAKQRTGKAEGGGGDRSSSSRSSKPKSDWMSALDQKEKELAQVIAPILSSSGIHQKKIVTLLPKVATRIEPSEAKRYTLAALASAYSDPDAKTPNLLAVYRMAENSVPVQFMNSDTWRAIPAEILKAADVDIDRLPRQASKPATGKNADIDRILGVPVNG